EPSFLPVEEVDWLWHVDPSVVSTYEPISDALRRSILVAGRAEEQQFLLIAPKSPDESWQYWKFANWIPGEHAYAGLAPYFEHVITSLESLIDENTSPK
ncbi:MAG: hypothetical protein KDC54_01435, partial [Lewinella sp.]|nr:hypothetical protein [Lewinella sp.]